MSCVFGDGNERLTIERYGGGLMGRWKLLEKIEKASQSKFAGETNEL